MAKPRKQLCRAPFRTLAVLLLMDGVPISALAISQALGYRWLLAVQVHLATLRKHGCWQIASTPQGYRLVGLPPDEMLAPTLREVDILKRSDWWVMRSTFQIQRTA